MKRILLLFLFVFVSSCSIIPTNMPKIGDTITVEQGKVLSTYFGLSYIVNRIEANPEAYMTWEFDGCSGIIDEGLGFFTGVSWFDITYSCCLPHDLGYAYGILGDVEEKQMVDKRFRKDLIKVGMNEVQADIFYYFVERFGAEELGLSFSWGYANAKIEN